MRKTERSRPYCERVHNLRFKLCFTSPFLIFHPWFILHLHSCVYVHFSMIYNGGYSGRIPGGINKLFEKNNREIGKKLAPSERKKSPKNKEIWTFSAIFYQFWVISSLKCSKFPRYVRFYRFQWYIPGKIRPRKQGKFGIWGFLGWGKNKKFGQNIHR